MKQQQYDGLMLRNWLYWRWIS